MTDVIDVLDIYRAFDAVGEPIRSLTQLKGTYTRVKVNESIYFEWWWCGYYVFAVSQPHLGQLATYQRVLGRYEYVSDDVNMYNYPEFVSTFDSVFDCIIDALTRFKP